MVLIFLVLASLFESILQPVIIMAEVPMGVIGAFATLKLAGQTLNVGALMGVILLGGIVVNKSIILVDEINRLRRDGMRIKRAVIAAAQSRVRPIAITSLTSTLGLLPLALSRTEESSLWAPMSLVVIGGLIFSTLMTPVIVPSFYLILEDMIRFISSLIRFKSQPLPEPNPAP